MKTEKDRIEQEIIEKVKLLINYIDSDIITIAIDIKKSMKKFDYKINETKTKKIKL